MKFLLNATGIHCSFARLARNGRVCVLASLCIVLVFVLDLLPLGVSGAPSLAFCGLGKDWYCPRNVEVVPAIVAEICEVCGAYWGNVPGFEYCCRCEDRIFGFCLEAVTGGK